MKLYWIIFLFTTVVLSQNTDDEYESNKIIWNQDKKLEWKDFTGALDPNLFGNALTSYKIEIIPENVLVDADDNIQNYENLTVVAKFYKDKSWVTSRTDGLLAHEQLHFDIAELYARKIRKKFSELKSVNEQRFAVYASAYELLWQECREYQKMYDSQTKNGILTEENNIWINKVLNEIMELNEFK